MAQTIKNMSELKHILQVRANFALKKTRDDVFKVIQKHITNYYHEKVFVDENNTPSSIPNAYKRTYQFLNSLIKTEVISVGNSLCCSVEIDMDSMHYLQSPKTVVDMINRGYHADTSLNDSKYKTPYDIWSTSNFWDDAIEELGGKEGIIQMTKSNLKKFGIPIVN